MKKLSILLTMFFVSSIAYAEIYTWKSDGVTHFSNVNPPKHAKKIKEYDTTTDVYKWVSNGVTHYSNISPPKNAKIIKDNISIIHKDDKEKKQLEQNQLSIDKIQFYQSGQPQISQPAQPKRSDIEALILLKEQEIKMRQECIKAQNLLNCDNAKEVKKFCENILNIK